jgi:hypothetical protein
MTDATTTLTLTAGIKCYPSLRKGNAAFDGFCGSISFRKNRRVPQFGGLFGRSDLVAGPGTQIDLGRFDAPVPELLLRYPQVLEAVPECMLMSSVSIRSP